MSTTKKKATKKKSAKKSTKKTAAKKKSEPKKKLNPEETKTRLKKLFAGLKDTEDQKEKKNIRAKLRTTAKNWKDILGIKAEKKATKKTTKKKAAKSEGKSTKKKKKSTSGKKSATA